MYSQALKRLLCTRCVNSVIQRMCRESCTSIAKRVYGTKKSNRFLTVTYSFRPTADDYYTIRKIHGVGNFVSKTTCLSCTEEEYIIELCRNPDILKVSKGHIENGVLKIDSGYLKRYEHKIVKFSRRQHKAVIEITLYGESHRITCALDIDKCSN